MIQEMYRVRSSVGETDGFEVKVGQLSSFIFNIVMDVTTRNRREDLHINLERWRTAMEERGMRISRSKTEYMCTSIDERSINTDGEELKRVQKVTYLGSIVDACGNMDEEVKHRVQAGWNNWRSASEGPLGQESTSKTEGKVS
ncbi:uncharacterized protein [Penaeus vannamei]|uniref:uncharacterized protein n=1 Tax=Penaeus vannamei TaxID=6689 RepID=UPI00387F498E